MVVCYAGVDGVQDMDSLQKKKKAVPLKTSRPPVSVQQTRASLSEGSDAPVTQWTLI